MPVNCPKCQFENPDDTQFCWNCASPLKPAEENPFEETAEVPKKELTTGAIFSGRYQIIEELGKGGMGKVYKAFDTEINAKLALKLIKPEISADKKTIDRLKQELKIAREIVHKNICRMYDINKKDGTYFITMEYVDGQDLKSLIRQTGQLALPTAVSIAEQLCEGLEEAHKLGVVHRDLKPGNIMIDKDGNVRIMDFGIAFSVDTRATTVAGIMIGTPLYMSPEQASAESIDQRSDIYSLGIILYEMTTGVLPFHGDDLLSIAMKHKSEMAKSPREYNPSIPENLNNLILKCLAKDKKERYQSAQELLSALRNLKMEFRKIDKSSKIKWEDSIAVLPFTDLSPTKDQEYFCDGMAEELINVLSQIKGLKVVARTSAFSFKGKSLDVRELGGQLGVDRILEGSVRKSGNRLRISIQLIDPSDGFQIWSERFDREIEDVFAIQDEVTMAVVEKFKINLLTVEKEQLLKHRQQDPEEYNLYLLGRYFLNKRTEEGFHKSISYFEQMINRNPSSSYGYAGLAEAYDSLGYFNYLSSEKAYSRARQEAEKALALDETLAEAYVSLASVKLFYDWNLSEAELILLRAIRYNPSYITAHHRLAFSLSASGKHEEAIDQIKQAQALDPLSSMINTAAAWVFYLAKRYDWAIEQCERIHETDPHYHVAYAISGLAYMEKNSFGKAISLFQKSLKLEKNDIAPLGYLGMAYVRADKKNKAEKILLQIEDLSKTRYVAPIYRSVIFTGLGENKQALEWLEKGFRERNPWMIFLKAWPIFDSLNSEPQYKAIINNLRSE